MDLSSSRGLSVNAEDFSLRYITVDHVINMVSSFEKGALMARFDVESAYCNIAVQPADPVLLV